mmetsp:Transcript_29799/g.96129  ORF Transcript_29799/g.96129 Transcript_29799/m.96129 type:complete len:251 (-) Transcript_29799:156-908(-)
MLAEPSLLEVETGSYLTSSSPARAYMRWTWTELANQTRKTERATRLVARVGTPSPQRAKICAAQRASCAKCPTVSSSSPLAVTTTWTARRTRARKPTKSWAVEKTPWTTAIHCQASSWARAAETKTLPSPAKPAASDWKVTWSVRIFCRRVPSMMGEKVATMSWSTGARRLIVSHDDANAQHVAPNVHNVTRGSVAKITLTVPVNASSVSVFAGSACPHRTGHVSTTRPINASRRRDAYRTSRRFFKDLD